MLISFAQDSQIRTYLNWLLRRRATGRRTGERTAYMAIESLESRQLLSATIGVISEAGDGSGGLVSTIENVVGADFLEFQVDGRWTTTATDGDGLVMGETTTLTWSFADDGTNIPGLNGEPASPSSLIAFLDSVRPGGSGSDLTLRPWFGLFRDSFNRMGEISGLNYVYEPNDDAVAFTNSGASTGLLGTRGDVRIGGHFIDGTAGTNTLAYNFGPNNGDMVIDTGNIAFYTDTTNNSRGLRNTLMHEAGHGVGLDHVDSSDAGFLLEPILDTAFDGPQLDDILALQRLYGDAFNDNLVDFGLIGVGGASVVGNLGSATVVTPNPDGFDGFRFISIDDETNDDLYSFSVAAGHRVTLTLTPQGVTYQQGPQGGTQSAFNSKAQSNLVLELLGTNQTTVLATANAIGAGGVETLTFNLPSAGKFFIRAKGLTPDVVQLYQLGITMAAGPANVAPVVNNQTASLAENFPNGSSLFSVTATDNPNQTLFYEIVNGNTNNAFAINSTTGALTVNNSSALDFETHPVFTLVVKVTDNGTPALSGTGTITINLFDQIEAPEIEVKQGSANVADGGSFAFGTATQGGAVISKTYTIKNIGIAPLTLQPASFSSGAGYTITTNIPTNHQLAPNATFNLIVRMDTTTAGAKTAALTFNNTDANEGPFNFTLTGTVNPSGGGNVAPTITLWDGSTAYAESALPVVIDTNAAVTDVDSLNFSTGVLTVQVTTNVEVAFDRVGIKHIGNAANQIGVSGTTVSFGGVAIGTFIAGPRLTVTFNTSSTVAAAAALLKAITFHSLSENPSTLPRTVTAMLTDGDGGTSATLSKTVTVTKTNDAPVITLWDGTVAYAENAVPVVLDSNAVVADADSLDFSTGKLTVQITTNVEAAFDRLGIKHVGTAANQIGVAGTTVSFGGVAIGTFAGTTTLIVTLNASATVAATSALLKAITFSSLSNNPSILTRTVTAMLTDGDGGTSAVLSKTVTVTKINDVPVLTLWDGTVAYAENAVPMVLDSNAAVADVDSLDFSTGILTVQVTTNVEVAFDRLGIKHIGNAANQIGVSGTTVSFGGVAIGTFIAGPRLTVTLNANANVAAAAALLKAITFHSTSENPSTLPRTVTAMLTDGEGGTSAVVSKTVTVTRTNDVPVITAFDTAISWTEGALPVLLDTNAAVTDVDSANFDTGRLNVYFPVGSTADRLGIKHTGNLAGQIGVVGTTVNYGGVPIGTFTGGTIAPLIITFNSAANKAAVDKLLRALTFHNVSTNPSTLPRIASLFLTDGDGGTSLTVTKTLTVIAVPDTPAPTTIPWSTAKKDGDIWA